MTITRPKGIHLGLEVSGTIAAFDLGNKMAFERSLSR